MAYTNIDDPSAYFQTLLWTGNSTDGRALTNDGNSDLQPDWVWLKNRNAGYNHFLTDSSRGNTKVLFSDLTNAEGTYTDMVESFDTNGFTVGFDGGQVPNFNGNTFVGWQWKANGGTTSSNTDGGVTSTVQVNQDAGFSIVTWTGDGANETIGHGLGTTPQVIITKDRDSANNWNMYHHQTNASAPYNYPVQLNLTVAASLATGSFGTSSSDINSNTFYLKYWYNYSGDMIAYCFAEKQGYSKFGKYVGNGSTNGPFVYLGFQPAWILLKRSDSISDWYIIDNKRSASGGANVNVYTLFPNLSAAESTGEAESTYGIDFLSNGFKIRASHSSRNTSGGSYIYMAFAENPFTTSTGIPTTAR